MDAQRPDLRDLLAAYREEERLGAASRAAAWRSIQAALHPPAAPAVARFDRRPLVVAAVLLAAAALLLLVRPHEIAERAAVTAPQEAAHDADEPPLHSVVATQPPTMGPAQPRDVSPAPPEPLVEAPPPRAAPRRVRTAAPPIAAPPQLPDLERELEILRTARAAVTRGDTTAAMAALAEHAERFSDGHLREERLVLRVEALCAAGSREQARTEAAAFADAHPASPHTRKIQRICE